VRYSYSDRVRVSRVKIRRDGNQHEIPGCWIGVDPENGAVQIWLSPEAAPPLVVVPLRDAEIEWLEMEPPLP
jgi:hypothetical protein